VNTPADLNKRRALGRGLEALIPSVKQIERESESVDLDTSSPRGDYSATIPEQGKPREIPVEFIDRNPFQTRTSFDEKQMEDLTASIAAMGVVQPIVVRPIEGGRFQLIAGERRWIASKRAGKPTIPSIIRPASDEQAMEMTIVENLQRADLNPIEQARAFDRLSREFKMTQEQMAQRTGKDRTSVSNFLRLLRLPADVQTKVESGELSFGHARSLLSLDSGEAMLKVAQRILAQSLSVRQTESYVQGLLSPEKKIALQAKAAVDLDPNVRDAQERLQRALGLKVQIEDKNGRGRVIIEYARLEDFDTLLDSILNPYGAAPASG
jgi:ParB family chromosome partitioning protein